LSPNVKDEIDHLEKKLHDQIEKERRDMFSQVATLVPAVPNSEKIQALQDHYRVLDRTERYRTYHLNIRGLILYLVGEISLYGDTSSTNQHIIQVLKNLSSKFHTEFPFLKEYNSLTELFLKINEKDYSLQVLKQIAKNIKRIIGHNSYLLEYIVMKNYFEEITLYLLSAMDERLLEEDANSLRKTQTYSLANLRRMETYLKEELEKISSQISYIQGNPNAETLFEAYDYPL
jgi:hypothetical protein